jgi:hypothetical protein
MIIRIINGMKGGTNKCLSEFQENSHEQLNEIRKIVQDLKEIVNKDIEI